MAKIKLHNKGQKIIAINGAPLLPGKAVEVEDSYIKIPVIASLIKKGFLVTNAIASTTSVNTNKGGSVGSSNSEGKTGTNNENSGK